MNWISSVIFNNFFNLPGDTIKKYSEYVVGFTHNDLRSSELTLFVTTTEVGPVLFVIETLLGFMFTGIAMNNSTTVVHLSDSYKVHNSMDRNKGIRIYGDKQITLYGHNYGISGFTADAFWLCCVHHIGLMSTFTMDLCMQAITRNHSFSLLLVKTIQQLL